MKDNNKKSDGKKSSADNVAEHLERLAGNDAVEQRYYSQEQPFSAEELASVINEARLNELLMQSDEFLSGLSGEIGDFDE